MVLRSLAIGRFHALTALAETATCGSVTEGGVNGTTNSRNDVVMLLFPPIVMVAVVVLLTFADQMKGLVQGLQIIEAEANAEELDFRVMGLNVCGHSINLSVADRIGAGLAVKIGIVIAIAEDNNGLRSVTAGGRGREREDSVVELRKSAGQRSALATANLGSCGDLSRLGQGRLTAITSQRVDSGVDVVRTDTLEQLQNDFQVGIEDSEQDVHAGRQDAEEVREIVSELALIIELLLADGGRTVKENEDVSLFLGSLADAVGRFHEESGVGREGSPIHK